MRCSHVGGGGLAPEQHTLADGTAAFKGGEAARAADGEGVDRGVGGGDRAGYGGVVDLGEDVYPTLDQQEDVEACLRVSACASKRVSVKRERSWLGSAVCWPRGMR